MRRIAPLLLLAGCFGEPIDDKVATSVVMPMESSAEESSSSAGESSSGDESSSGEAFDPHACPEWCGHCDLVGGYVLCRCGTDLDCEQGTACNRPEQLEPGHCM